MKRYLSSNKIPGEQCSLELSFILSFFFFFFNWIIYFRNHRILVRGSDWKNTIAGEIVPAFLLNKYLSFTLRKLFSHLSLPTCSFSQVIFISIILDIISFEGDLQRSQVFLKSSLLCNMNYWHAWGPPCWLTHSEQIGDGVPMCIENRLTEMGTKGWGQWECDECGLL